VTAAGPLRGPHNRGGYAAAAPLAPAEGYGAAPPASRVPRIALRATALRAALDPGASTAPGARKSGQATACPRRVRAQAGQPAVQQDHHNKVFTHSGEPRMK
jgi:hypothetical protein